MDCYWLALMADLSLMAAIIFALLWWRLHRRYWEQGEMFREYAKNVNAVHRHFDILEYERYSQEHEHLPDPPENK